MTSFSEEETERLVELIKQHPILYNSQLNEYKDDISKENTWQSIADAMNKSVAECRKKWRLTKDSYNRYKRKIKNSTRMGAPPKNSKYQFFEGLRFLEGRSLDSQSVINIGSVKENSCSDGANSEVDEVLVENIMPEIVLNDVKKEESNKRIKIEDEFLNDLKERHENRLQTMPTSPVLIPSTMVSQPMDDIAAFIKNIEMSLRKLTPRSRILAKKEMFEVMTKYEMVDIEENTTSAYNYSGYL